MEGKELGIGEVPSPGLGTEGVCCLFVEIRLLVTPQSPNSYLRIHWRMTKGRASVSVGFSSFSVLERKQPSVVCVSWEWVLGLLMVSSPCLPSYPLPPVCQHHELIAACPVSVPSDQMALTP